MESKSDKIKVEIWSDVMCPFCYIGKRKFESAMDGFAHREDVEVVWKSFQLDPSMKTDPNVTINQMLAEKKGWTVEQARQMNEHVTGLAAAVGLTYRFDKAIVANSFDAHRFSHLAATHGLQDQAEERLFAAYFTEGKNTADHQTLVELGTEIGLDGQEVATMLAGDDYAADVQQDIYQAQQVGARGVPFFVLGGKYAVSGAQESSTFLQALDQTWSEWSKENAAKPQVIGGDATCTPDGCDVAN